MHHVLTLTTLIQQTNNNGQYLYVAFIDFRKIFDTVSRDMLWKKLSAISLRGLVLTALIALHSNAAARIRISSVLSQSFPQDMGLRQGCVFWHLYNLFCSSLICQLHLTRAQNFDLTTLLLITYSTLMTLYYLLQHL